jgi:hypothetical protein
MFNFFCKHEWELLTETITESQFEHAASIIRSVSGGKVNIPGQMCDAERKHIQVFTCTECGILKRFVERV